MFSCGKGQLLEKLVLAGCFVSFLEQFVYVGFIYHGTCMIGRADLCRSDEDCVVIGLTKIPRLRL